MPHLFSKKKHPSSRSRFAVMAILIFLIIIIAAALAARFVFGAAQSTYRQVAAAKVVAQETTRTAQAGEWGASARAAEELADSIPQFQQTLDAARLVRWVPGVGAYIRDAEGLLREADIIVREYVAIAVTLEEVQDAAEGSLADANTRTALIRTGAQLDVHAQKALTAAYAALDIWDDSPWQQRIAFDGAQARASLETGERQLAAARLVYALVTPSVERNYLLLFQNNTELRPTGGFIGNYGVVTVQNGEVKHLVVDDIYALDRPAEGTLDITPPEPLQQYFNRTQWMLRDINWSPDFPTTAQRAVTMYALEGGSEAIDGVVAITPAVVNDLFAVVGPVVVDGITYDEHNFVDTLQYEVEKGFVDAGLPESQRKRVVQIITATLHERLMQLPLENFDRFNNRFVRHFDEKNVQIFTFNEAVQGLAHEWGWDGAVADGDRNALLVVDANLGSFKTDPAVARTISYQVLPENPTDIEVSITYRHDGTQDWKTSHYRTYTRLYVPAGSELLAAEGAMRDDTQAPGEVDVTTENGRTVFGAFVVTNPNEEQTLTVRYRVPRQLAAAQGSRLLLEKQAGNVYTSYRITPIEGSVMVQRGVLEKNTVFELR